MNKKLVTTIVLGSTVVGGAVLAQDAHASEEVKPSTDSKYVVKTEVGKTTKEDVATVKQKADESKAKFDTQKAKTEAKMEQAKQVSTKVAELTTKVEKGASATEEVIKEKSDKVEELKTTKESLTKKGEQAQPIIKKAEENTKSAQKVVEETTKDLATKTEKAKDIENKLNTLENSNEVLKAKKDEIKDLKKATDVATATVTKKEENLKQAKASDEHRAQDIKDAKDAVSTQKSVVKSTNDKLDTTKNKASKLAKEIRDSASPFGEYAKTKIQFDEDFVKALKEYNNAPFKKKEELLPGLIEKEKVAVKRYPILSTSAREYTGEKVDINNLSQEDKVLFSQYFNYLNNQVRKQFGLPEQHTNLNILKFADDIAKFTKESNFTATQHDHRSINKAAYKNGIDKTDKGTVYNRFESLDFNTINTNRYPDKLVPKSLLFDSIYQSVQRFYHEGRSNGHYLHAAHLLSNKEQATATYFVLTNSPSEYYQYLRFGVVGVHPNFGITGYNEDGTPNYSKYDQLWGKKSAQTLPLLEVKDVSALQSQLETTKGDIARLERELADANKELTKRENALKFAESKPTLVEKATKELEVAKTNKDIKVLALAKAEQELKDIQKLIDTEQAHATKLRDELTKAKDEVAQAESKSAKAKGELVTAQKLEEQAKATMKTLTDELARLQAEIEKTELEKDELIKLKAEYDVNIKELAKANEDLETARKLISEALVELADLEKDATAKFDEYIKIKRQYDLENLTWAVLKDTPVFELPEFDLKELDKPTTKPVKPTVKTDVKVTKPVTTKAVEPKFGKASEKVNVKTTAKDEVRKLPNTGDTTTDLAGFGIVSMLMASYAVSRRKNEK